jgi:hypothetical protein
MHLDFVEYVKSFRYRRWQIDRVGTRISKVFTLQFVFGLTKNKELWKVAGRLNGFRRRWIYRLRELTGNELWLLTSDKRSPYHPDFDFEKFSGALRRCMFCRPTVVHFHSKDGRSVKIRPCWRTHICPFCWANLTGAQYVSVKQAINKLVKRDNNLVAVCRVVREYVPAPGFDLHVGPTPAQIKQYEKILRRTIKKHKTRYQQLVQKKTLQRKTIGSLWRLVVIPDQAGWQIEVRQFFVCRADSQPPTVNTRGCRIVFSQTIRLNNERFKMLEEFFNLFGAFCQYPVELLSGYGQLVAAYLNAAHDQRLISGTGVFKKSGRSLIRYMREYIENARATKEAKKAQRALKRAAAQIAGDPQTG